MTHLGRSATHPELDVENKGSNDDSNINNDSHNNNNNNNDDDKANNNQDNTADGSGILNTEEHEEDLAVEQATADGELEKEMQEGEGDENGEGDDDGDERVGEP